MIFKKLWFLSLLLAHNLIADQVKEREMVIVIPSYNNEKWYAMNLESALEQNYGNFRIIYINDCSTDATGGRVEQYLKLKRPGSYRVISFDGSASQNIPEVTAIFKDAVNREEVFFTLVNNTTRCGALENLYRGIQSCNNQEIVITLDGDDWFPHDEVLKKINEVYASGEIWMTHGRLVEYPHGTDVWCEPVPPELVASNRVRQFKCPSHLRTFYAWIFKKIALEDLLYKGKFFPMTWDMAMMYPMLEMAGERHAFVSEVNYVYNMDNPINDGKVDRDLQNELDRVIRNMKPYQRLEKAE